jgi:hypothetical protein
MAARDTVLSPRRDRAVRALLPVFCPADIDDPALADAVVRHVERTASSVAPLTRGALLSAFDLIEAMGLRHGRPTSRLPIGTRRRAVALMGTRSRTLRRVVRSARDVLVVAYFDQPAVKARLGYLPDAWTEEVARERLERWAPEIAAHEALLRRPRPAPPLSS